MSRATELERLLQFFYQCPVGLIEIDDTGRVDKINPAAVRMLAPALGGDLAEAFPLLDRLAPGLTDVIRGDPRRLGPLATGRRIIRLPGPAPDPQFELTAVRVDHDRVMLTLVDVSEERRLARREQELAHELQQAMAHRIRELALSNRELDAFAHAASHDLKEPLRGIAAYTAFVLEDSADRLDPSARERLESVQRLTDRMDQLLESLLHYAQLGRTSLDRVAVRLDDVLDDVLETLAVRLAESGVDVRRPGPLPTVPGDAVHLRELFLNLVLNAIKYRGTVDPWIEIGASAATAAGSPGAPGDVAAVYVRDNGIGIRATQLEDIFTIFRRLHREGARGGGSGVGLTLARRVAERHGGRLWAESEPGRGSTFRLTLPGTGPGQALGGTQ